LDYTVVAGEVLEDCVRTSIESFIYLPYLKGENVPRPKKAKHLFGEHSEEDPDTILYGFQNLSGKVLE
jgi:hypothetical protein